MACKHDISLLMGTADGIVCRGCGKLFPNFDAVLADRGEAPAPAPVEEKKPATKKTASKKAKKEE